VSDAAGSDIVGAAPANVERRRTLEEAARGDASAAKAPNTLRAYRSDLRDFEAWCATRSAVAVPASPVTVTLYCTALAEAGAKASTIQRRLTAISQAHQLAGHHPSPTADPVVRTTMAGIRRTLGTAPAQKAAVVTAELRRLLAATPEETLAGRRDRTILLLGFAGGLRRSELVALDVEDLTETVDGLRVRLRRSKTDQESEGEEVGIPFGQHPDTCPIRALRAWRAHAGIITGALFRGVNRHDQLASARLSDGSIARIVQRAAHRSGLDPARYAGHSLRSGLAATAALGGAPERAIMRQGRWKSVAIARGYVHAGTLFEENAAAYCGL
jgi:site-specific recombinase XerD